MNFAQIVRRMAWSIVYSSNLEQIRESFFAEFAGDEESFYLSYQSAVLLAKDFVG